MFLCNKPSIFQHGGYQIFHMQKWGTQNANTTINYMFLLDNLFGYLVKLFLEFFPDIKINPLIIFIFLKCGFNINSKI